MDYNSDIKLLATDITFDGLINLQTKNCDND